MMGAPVCFISYDKQTTGNEIWVNKLAGDLKKNNIDVLLDDNSLEFGSDLARFMESGIRDSNFVLIVCTENYARKVNNEEGGVGFEKKYYCWGNDVKSFNKKVHSTTSKWKCICGHSIFFKIKSIC